MPSNMVTVRMKREEAEALLWQTGGAPAGTPVPRASTLHAASESARAKLRSALAAEEDPHSTEQFAAEVATDNVRLRCGLQGEVKRLSADANSLGRRSQHQANMLRDLADRLSALLDEEGSE